MVGRNSFFFFFFFFYEVKYLNIGLDKSRYQVSIFLICP